MKPDIEIAQNSNMQHIVKIAQKIGLNEDCLEQYGKYKAKINLSWEHLINKPKGNLVLVTAISPTPLGEGKTTTCIGLGDSLNKLGVQTITALREPSLGPCFGMKGGATGGGYAQVTPMEDINLHFTGDIHSITVAHNLLTALIDNHLYHGNELQIKAETIVWGRVLDLNDRALREIHYNTGKNKSPIARDSYFDITVASELMAILCLSKGLEDLKLRIGNILVGFNTNNKPVFVKDLGIVGAIASLFKESIKPNLVQSLENNPVIIHGGPFANISHGCNSIIATNMALSLSDVVVTEAGFGADLGGEKFLNIKSEVLGVKPSATVIVATLKALKYHGGVLVDFNLPNMEALQKGFFNLEKHINNLKQFGINPIVALNYFPHDTIEELDCVKNKCLDLQVECIVSKVFSEGSAGGLELAKKVMDKLNGSDVVNLLYKKEEPVIEKIEKIAKNIYGASEVIYSENALVSINEINKLGWSNLPICMAKTPYSFSGDPKLLGVASNFPIYINEVKVKLGAGFIVCIVGNVMTMPGLPKRPAANNINIDNNGKITGLF